MFDTERFPDPCQFRGIGDVEVVVRVVHVADDVDDRPLGQQRLVVLGERVRAHPVVVVSDAAERLDLLLPDRLEAHAVTRGVQVGLEGHELRVLLQHLVRVELLSVLVGHDGDVETVAQAHPRAPVLGLVVLGVELEAELEVRPVVVMPVECMCADSDRICGPALSRRPAPSGK